MSTKFKAPDYSIKPAIYIGLGGVGSRIVDRIAMRSMLLPNWESQIKNLVQFVSIDTNTRDQNDIKSIPPGNRILIGNLDKRAAVEGYKRSNNQQATQWIDANYEPRKGTTPGAGQIRVESRLGFFHHSQSIRSHLESIIDGIRGEEGVSARESTEGVDIYIFCTLAGGTGSGSFLSASFLAKKIIEERGWQPRVIGHFLLSTLVTDKVAPSLHQDIHTNTYAALKELECVNALGRDPIKKMGMGEIEFNFERMHEGQERKSIISEGLYYLSFIYDIPQHMDIRNMPDAIADNVLIQTMSPVIKTMDSELDNYVKKIGDLTFLPGDKKEVSVGYSKVYGASGAATLIVPGKDLLAYCTRRFAAESIRIQITFGQDKSSGGGDDDRSRALAKLAIDYSDSKFQNMSEEAKHNAINQTFVASINELSRQDERDDIEGGFWRTLVEATTLGKKSGVDTDTGEEIRDETYLDVINRKMREDVRKVMNKLDLEASDITGPLHPESVGQYTERLSKLFKQFKKANSQVDDQLELVTRSAAEGELISELELNPIAERYVVLDILRELEETQIPMAEKAVEQCSGSEIGSQETRTRLEVEGYQSLVDASKKKGVFKRVDEDRFISIKESVKSDVIATVDASRTLIEAKIELAQLRSLREYLSTRSKQYISLATKMDGLVNQLETDAELFRNRSKSLDVLPKQRVEVFASLESSKDRMWDKVYKALFINDGRYISTFDRKVLAETISEQLKPRIVKGRVTHKSVDEMVSDIEAAMLQLGENIMLPVIGGYGQNEGLNVASALELEAELVLETEDRNLLDNYIARKIRVLSVLCGVLARVDSISRESWSDGVDIDSVRYYFSSFGDGEYENFTRLLQAGLNEKSGFNVKTEKQREWFDSHSVIVQDVVFPMPLYYFSAIEGLENHYVSSATDMTRSWNLHTDKNWEKALPNLSPTRSEISIDWSFEFFVRARAAGVVGFDQESKNWVISFGGKKLVQGETIALAMYSIGKIVMTQPHAAKQLEQDVSEKIAALSASELLSRLDNESELIRQRLKSFEADSFNDELDPLERRDGPVWRGLLVAIEHQKSIAREDQSKLSERYDGFGS